MDHSRRELILGLVALAATPRSLAAQLTPTPRQTVGPFYPVEPPLTRDNDLVQVPHRAGTAKGRISQVTGQVLDLNGRPLAGLRVEIWQCDAYGRYRHPRDLTGRIDENFQGFGHTVTDDQGRYRFRTIRPVPYGSRTPHIHFALFPQGAERFATQLYVQGEPRNAQDFLFTRIPPEKRHLVTAKFEPAAAEGAELEAAFDIVLGPGGTPPDR